MKLLPPIYCLFFTLCPVFASEHPFDPINNYEIEKQRRRDNIPKIDELMAMLRIEREIVQNLQVARNANPALSRSSKWAPTVFKSELFKSGKLIYADDFNGAINKEFWGQPKGKKIKDGILTVGPLFKSKEEAMNALKRDHPVSYTHLTLPTKKRV